MYYKYKNKNKKPNTYNLLTMILATLLQHPVRVIEPFNYFQVVHALQNRDELSKKRAVKQVLVNHGRISLKKGGLELVFKNAGHFEGIKGEWERVSALLEAEKVVIIQRRVKSMIERNRFLMKRRAANYIKYQWLHTYYKVSGSSKTFL